MNLFSTFKTLILLVIFTCFSIYPCFAQPKYDKKEYFTNIINSFNQSSDKDKIVEMACDSAVRHQISSEDNEEMLLYFLKYAHKNDSKISYKLYLALGIQYMYNELGTDLSIEYFFKALQTKEINNDLYCLAKAQVNMAQMFYKVDDFNETKKYLLKSEQYNDLFMTNKRWITNFYNTLAMSFFKTNGYEKSEKYYQKALQNAIVEKDTIWIGLINGNLGTLYYKQKKYLQALKLLEMDINISRRFKKEENAIISLVDIINIHIEQNELEKAKEKLEEGIILLSKLDKKIDNLRAFFLLYDCASLFYKTKKQYQKALEYSEMKEITIKEYENLFKNKNLEKLKFQYQHKNELLELDELTKQNQNQQTYLYLVISILLIFILLAAIIFQKYIVNRKNTNLLMIQKQKITAQTQILSKQNMKIKLQNDNLQTLNQIKNKLFSLISHDLRSPLISLKGILTLLNSDNLSLEEMKMMAPLLNNNVDKTLKLTEDLLFWGKSQLEGVILQTQKININEFIKDKVKKLNFLDKIKKLDIKAKLDQKAKNVSADENMLQAIIRNLINNAIKFSNEEDSITISTQLSEDGKFVICCISDTGVGISAENVEKIFKGTIFTTKGTKGEKGTGFGMLLCKDFVSLNGGKIWVESALGKGSNFYFTIPV